MEPPKATTGDSIRPQHTSEIKPTHDDSNTNTPLATMPHSTVSTSSFDSTTKTDFYPSQNKHTEANIFPEPSIAAEADIEHNKHAPDPQGLSPADFPENAWLVVLGAWCGLFCSFGWLNSIGVFQEYYQFNQLAAYTPSEIAWIPSMELFIMFFAGPIAGKLFDNFGPRYVLLAGSILQVFGLMMTSLSSKYYQILLAQGLVAGFGGSFVFFACIAPIPTWFYAKRGTALGIASTGSSIGGVVFPIMLRKIIPKVGFGWAMRIVAFTILGMLIIANLFVKSRLKPHPKPVKASDLWKPMTELPFALMVLGSVFFNFGTYIPYNFVMLHARKYGMSLDLVTYLLPIMSGARYVSFHSLPSLSQASCTDFIIVYLAASFPAS